MSQELVTAAVIRDGALNNAMDAIAIKDRQLELLCDFIEALAELLGVELELERTIAGWADELTRDLQHARHVDEQPGQALSGRRLAWLLVPHLDLLRDPLQLERHPQARKALHDLFAATPRAMIFRPAVAYHVGKRRQATLEDVYGRWAQARMGRERKARTDDETQVAA